MIDALQDSGRKREKERCILEVRNKIVSPDDPQIIKKIITLLKKTFGKTSTNMFFESWQEFIELKMKSGESFEDFILRLDTIDSKLKALNETLSQRALACHLVYKLEVNEMEKQNMIVR